MRPITPIELALSTAWYALFTSEGAHTVRTIYADNTTKGTLIGIPVSKVTLVGNELLLQPHCPLIWTRAVWAQKKTNTPSRAKYHVPFRITT